jgi:hypothetical protein
MRERYLDLETGITLSIKELLEFENQKDGVWEAADEMRSLLENLLEAREEVVQELQYEANLIRDSLKKYDAAVEKLDGSEGGHQAPEPHFRNITEFPRASNTGSRVSENRDSRQLGE